MIIPEVAPMLTCTASNDGFVYELVLRAAEGRPAITKVAFGPYFFKPEYQPKKGLFGMTRGGPESDFLMHRRIPAGWSRLRWELVTTEPDQPTYLVSTGTLRPGEQGMFSFLSLYKPGGLRVGLAVYRGSSTSECGVSGPDYTRFMRGDHGH